MSRTFSRRLAFAILLVATLDLDGKVQSGPGDPRCPPPPDGGTLVCRARCEGGGPFGSYCQFSAQAQPTDTFYCYQVRYLGDVWTTACHEDDYDRCCDVNAQY
ncbi:MAG TPA: hypothetical protein VGQ76_11480 [Thermoanaerobaculia bacterium]|jgi:hypothetical protein|nr:hypothetical protein [Thermoanaerobaculia bacterium]